QIHINNPETSQRNIALESNLSKSGVQKIIKKHKYHDYKVKPVQTIHPGDNERRLQFCNWFRDEIREDHDVPCKILWSDESLFTNSGIFNRRNKHFYATQNPYLIQEVRPQIRFSLNHDGAGPHTQRIVRQILGHNRFPRSWIGNNGPIISYGVSTVKNRVYDRPIQNLEQLRARIIEQCQSITGEKIQKAVRDMDRRTSLCIERGGRHFEQIPT
ncbi:hypothetical protein NQ315_006790, partial [Exocentrus adspersus]